MSRRAKDIILVVVVALVVAALIFIVHRNSQQSRDEGNASVQHEVIPMSDGVKLQALLVTPKSASTQAMPLIVIPTSWGARENAFALLAGHVAEQGYIVVAYTQRGQADSGGEIDFAGAKTRADVSTVIDWSLAHTRANPKRIGMYGSSYGGGISLLAAAKDPRIRAVVATSTWANLAGSFAQNDTVSTQGLTTLFNGVRLDPDFQALKTDLTSDPQKIANRLSALSPSRSAQNYVAELNHNDPAIMIANGYEDHLLPPRQLIRFFQSLTTPKRLQLTAGDHQQIEYNGIIGRPDPTVDDAVAWFGHYLKGQSEAITTQAPIQLQDIRTTTTRGYQKWPQATAQDKLDLPAPGKSTIGSTPAAWSDSIKAGVDTVATSGTTTAYPPVQAVLGKLNDQDAADWVGPTLTAPEQVTGSGSLHLSIASSEASTSLFVHLYDVAPSGTGSLMSFTPYTATGLTPGSPRSVTIGLQPITWTVPAGDHLEVVIDTVDPRYHSTATKGSTLTFGSTTADPATVTIPVA